MKAYTYPLALMTLGFLLSHFLHWILLFPLAFILLFLVKIKNAQSAFFYAFAGAFLLWFAVGFASSSQQEHLSTEMISKVFGGWPPLLFLALISMMAGILSGLFALAAYYFKSIFLKN